VDTQGNLALSGNPNDDIRQKMLQYFYDRTQNARSATGKFGVAARISTVKADLKKRYGFTQQQVISNLEYLVDRGWVNRVPETKHVTTTKGIHLPSTTYFYEISAAGVDKLEGGSEFQPKERFAGINIEATGSNVITLGDGNLVNAEYRQLFTSLSELRDQIVANPELSEKEKYTAAVDIGTLQDQLAKPDPDKQVMSRLWENVEKVAKVGGLVQLATQIGLGIQQILG
jgi:hypothetical protein